jgi:hypothetical protein
VRRWKASGLTARAFAAREGLNARTLSWCASRLRGESQSQSSFVDVTSLVTPPATPSLEVVVRDSVRVRVSAGFDPDLLRAVVAALEAR